MDRRYACLFYQLFINLHGFPGMVVQAQAVNTWPLSLLPRNVLYVHTFVMLRSLVIVPHRMHVYT